MDIKGEVFISTKYKKEDYSKLDLNNQSSIADWKKAIAIFDDRIRNRYIKPLNLLINDIKTNGFVIMSIECLLIETLLQFKEGKDEIKNNKKEYSDFLLQELSAYFDGNTCTQFYKGIRCGILHSAQTKNYTRLTEDDSYVVKEKDGILYVSVLQLLSTIDEYLDNYECKLLNEKEIIIRENFIKKMNMICKN